MQVAQADTLPKPAKELACPNALIEKYATKMKDRLTNDKNSQLVTRYIKNWADSAKIEAYSAHLTLCGLTGNRSEMPNFSYTHPLQASLIKKQRHEN